MGIWDKIEKEEEQLDLKQCMEDCHDEMKNMIINATDPLPKINIKPDDQMVNMKPDVKCSRCGFVVYGDAEHYEQRKKRHVLGRHTAHSVDGQRPYQGVISKSGMGGLDIGKVRWITVW